MKLARFRVTNFRSVEDSGWVDVDDVTALIGVNESGKTNLLLPLWKLKPARDGEIQPTSDYPKTIFGEIREDPGEYRFIEAEFDTGAAAAHIARAAGTTPRIAATVRVARSFDGEYTVEFPEHKQETTVRRNWLANELKRCAKEVIAAKPLISENELQGRLSVGLGEIAKSLPKAETINIGQLKRVRNDVKRLIPRKPKTTSKVVPPVQKLSEEISQKIRHCEPPTPEQRDEAREMVLKALPPFVYYSNYGNLDSEIYLPHVVENLQRDDLGTKEAAKARTLRVLFKFVRLNAEEILELGREFQDGSDQGRKPTEEEIEETAEKKEGSFDPSAISRRDADPEIPELVEAGRLPFPVRSGREPLPDLGGRRSPPHRGRTREPKLRAAMVPELLPRVPCGKPRPTPQSGPAAG